MIDITLLKMINQNIGGVLLYYLYAVLTSLFIIAPIYYVVFWLSELEKKQRDKKYDALLPTRCTLPPIFLGILEQFLYITMIVLGHPEFIAVWLAYKVLGIWRRWEGEKDRISYNMFTIGTALSILNALFWSLIISAKFFIS